MWKTPISMLSVLILSSIAATAIEGTWQTVELAAGRPSSGDWTGRRVSSAHKANLDY